MSQVSVDIKDLIASGLISPDILDNCDVQTAMEVEGTQWDSEEYQTVRQVTKRFILSNYTNFSVTQLAWMLGVTIDYVSAQLTPKQLATGNRNRTHSVLVIRDISHLDSDVKRFEDG